MPNFRPRNTSLFSITLLTEPDVDIPLGDLFCTAKARDFSWFDKPLLSLIWTVLQGATALVYIDHNTSFPVSSTVSLCQQMERE